MSAQPKADDVTTRRTDGPAAVVQQALRREVNERIRSVNSGFGVADLETTDVICECVRPDCSGYVTMSVAEYELVRRFPTRFFVKEVHEVAEGERVVSEFDGFIVIGSSGRGGLYAVSADPRRRELRPAEVSA